MDRISKRVGRLIILFGLYSCQEPTSPEMDVPSTRIEVLGENFSPAKLVETLGCNSCHSGLTEIPDLKEAPPLAHAGLKYNPAYLFNYLQNPKRVRHTIGRSRMPDFRFSEEESLALTLFLSENKKNTKGWPAFPEISESSEGEVSGGIELLRKSTCLSCHDFQSKGNLLATDISGVAHKFKKEWLKQYLVSPAYFGVSHNKMPAFFYSISNDSSNFNALYPDSDKRIQSIVNYLFSVEVKRKNETEAQYQKVLQNTEQVDANLGRKIYMSQNCAACHGGEKSPRWEKHNAPGLNDFKSRVKPDWLEGFLKNPSPIRPFGYYPGTGSRMPDFRLSETEVAAIVSYFSMDEEQESVPQKKLSPFLINKAEKLLKDKLDCLGCHKFEGFGGIIGPDLTNITNRRTPGFVRKMIENPHEVDEQNSMPASRLPQKTKNLIIDYLIQYESSAQDTLGYLSLVDHEIIFGDPSSNAAIFQYQIYCATCHGIEGNGDGFNAGYLDVPPTKHSNGAYMSKRPNSTLYDGVHSGGYILNKSNQMPAWGGTLSGDEIQAIVSYMRALCDCDEPPWAQNGKN